MDLSYKVQVLDSKKISRNVIVSGAISLMHPKDSCGGDEKSRSKLTLVISSGAISLMHPKDSCGGDEKSLPGLGDEFS